MCDIVECEGWELFWCEFVYCGECLFIDIIGKMVIVVDDGLVIGVSMFVVV